MPMAQSNEHNPLIAAAAQTALLPLGCRRLGRSRTWISDQRFWVINIEFQPSNWSKGTYLNVGATWLWHARKGLSFHAGYRVADFIRFESVEQFEPLIKNMADRAAQEVLALRTRFKSLSLIHRYLITQISDNGWPVYHAAVASGLVGDAATSRRLFQRFETWSISPNWQTKLNTECAVLKELLDNPPGYRSKVLDIIERCRALNRLPADPKCLDAVNSRFERR